MRIEILYIFVRLFIIIILDIVQFTGVSRWSGCHGTAHIARTVSGKRRGHLRLQQWMWCDITPWDAANIFMGIQEHTCSNENGWTLNILLMITAHTHTHLYQPLYARNRTTREDRRYYNNNSMCGPVHTQGRTDVDWLWVCGWPLDKDRVAGGEGAVVSGAGLDCGLTFLVWRCVRNNIW